VKTLTQPEKNTLETILVVEHDQAVLGIVRSILECAGFRVLAAASGKEAMLVERQFSKSIHLLLSDVMTPDMSGPAISGLIKKHRPEMRVILMSAYEGGDMLFLNYGWHFVQGPFLPAKLIERVKDVLHTPERSQGEDQFDTRIAENII